MKEETLMKLSALRIIAFLALGFVSLLSFAASKPNVLVNHAGRRGLV